MVQERLSYTAPKGAIPKKDKAAIASPIIMQAPVKTQPKTTTAAADKNGAWGPIYKNKQNFIDMHCR
ncbi:hypothetical protein TKK_0018682 [Trichogramma kaykai]